MEVLMTAASVEQGMKMRQRGKNGVGWRKRGGSDYESKQVTKCDS